MPMVRNPAVRQASFGKPRRPQYESPTGFGRQRPSPGQRRIAEVAMQRGIRGLSDAAGEAIAHDQSAPCRKRSRTRQDLAKGAVAIVGVAITDILPKAAAIPPISALPYPFACTCTTRAPFARRSPPSHRCFRCRLQHPLPQLRLPAARSAPYGCKLQVLAFVQARHHHRKLDGFGFFHRQDHRLRDWVPF